VAHQHRLLEAGGIEQRHQRSGEAIEIEGLEGALAP
jgi:hypothetical protein